MLIGYIYFANKTFSLRTNNLYESSILTCSTYYKRKSIDGDCHVD